MKWTGIIKKYILSTFAVAIGIFVFFMPVSASEFPMDGISAEYTLANGFSYTVKSFEKDVPILNEERTAILEFKKEYSLVLPYGVKGSEVKILLDDADSFVADGKEYRNGEKYSFERGTYSVTCEGGEYNLNIFYTSDIPQMYITIEDDIDFVHEDKNNTSSGTVIITDGTTTEYSGGLEYIKGRGNATWSEDKKPYSIKLENKESLFGMDAAKKYAMMANHNDEAFIRNKLAMDFADKVGVDFCCQSHFVDLYVNNEYIGNYSLSEKVYVGESSVNIVNLDDINEQFNPMVDIPSLEQKGETGDEAYKNTGSYKWVDIPESLADTLDGGYLLEFELAERYKNEVSGFVSNYGQPIIIKSPEYASKRQVEYIMDYYNEFEEALLNDNGINSLGRHYSEYIDMKSMAKMYVMQEYVMNLDAGLTSFYMYKNVNGKLTMCSLWDMDYSLGCGVNRNYVDLSDPNSIWVTGGNLFNAIEDKKTIFTLLCQHSDFRRAAAEQWKNYFEPNIEELSKELNTLYSTIYDSAVLNIYRWRKYYTTPKESEARYTSAGEIVDKYIIKRAEFMSKFMSPDAVYVSYKRNGADGAMLDKYSYMPGDKATVLENEFDGGDAQFLGWNTAADGSGTAYMPGDVIGTEKEDVILYAQWDKMPFAEETVTQVQQQTGFFAGILLWFKNIFN